MSYYVKCEVCGEKFERVQWSHLFYTHGITLEEYRGKFPEATLVSEYIRDQVAGPMCGNSNAIGSKSRTGQTNSPETCQAIREAQTKLWSSLTPEQKDTKLRDSFLSPESKAKGTETRQRKFSEMSYEEIMQRVNSTIRSEEGIRRNLVAQSRKDISGDRNPNWRGGPNYSRDYGSGWSAVSELVKMRDNYTCQICYSTTAKLVTHHISHDTLDISRYNLVTLCSVCNGVVNGLDVYNYWVEKLTLLVRGKYSNHEVDNSFTYIE